MMKQQKFILVLFIFIFTFSASYAQELIGGKVIDESGEALPFATVVIEGTTIGTSTDVDGVFQLNAKVGQSVVVQFVGYKTETIEITNESETLIVTLTPETKTLDDVVVVGYGVQKKQSVVGAIGTARAEEIDQQGNVSNLRDAITGLIPGVSVLTSSGMPGGNLQETNNYHTGTEILIRGKTTWNTTSPLILVDGIEREMNDIDINEVESVSVLKDASATAVFGMKGGNGVILITTKRGREGKSKFNIEAETSFETPTRIVQVIDVPDAAIARNIGLERTRRFSQLYFDELYLADKEVEYYRTGEYPYAYQNIDWIDVMLRDFTTSHRVNGSATGGTKRVKYFASASYNHMGDLFNSYDLGQGYTPAFAYDRLNLRSNFDFSITKTTTLSANISTMFSSQVFPTGNGKQTIFGTFNQAAGSTPIMVYEDGVMGMKDERYNSDNPYYAFNISGRGTDLRTIVNMDYKLDQKLDFITEGLKFSAKLAYDNSFRNEGRSVSDDGRERKVIDKEFYLQGGYYDYETSTYMLGDAPANMDEFTLWEPKLSGNEGFGWVKEPNNYGTESNDIGSAVRSLYYQMQLRYNRSFGKHTVASMAVFSRFQTEKGSNWPGKEEDWVGRITYDFDERFLLEANGAYNGSEKFGPEYRFDFFPSISGGWIISNEKFIQDNATWLDNLKLRYSYGIVGNDRVNTGSQWPYLTMWNTYTIKKEEPAWYGYPTPYPSPGSLRFNEGDPGNPDLRWEKARKQNLGFEMAILKNTLSFTADFFKEYRYDMLISKGQRQVPPIFGKTPPPANLGEAKSHGAELELIFRNSINNKFFYWMSGNWSFARSEVIYKEDPELTPEHLKVSGKPIGQTFSGNSMGFAESWDDIYCNTGPTNENQRSYMMPGDLMMLDFDADGSYFGSKDNTPYGYPTYPQNNYGFAMGGNVKNLQISARFVGAYNVTRRVSVNLYSSDNLYVPTHLVQDTWSPEYGNENPTYPAFALSPKDYDPSGTYNEYDGSYFRLQSVQLSYTLPKKVSSKMKMDQVKLYVNGRNLFLLTHMPNDGVGTDYAGKSYPTRKQLNFGLNVRF
jgi:TonB-linked SusC/RagA family outer membrane protein